MCRSISIAPRARRAALIFILICLAAAAASAQSSPGAQPSPTPQAKPSPTPAERHFFGNILRDQRAIWTSPFHMGRGDAKWLAPLGASAAVLFATDRHTAGEASEGGANPSRVRISRDISRGGDFYTTGGIAAVFYLAGRARHNARARETGVLGAEALVDSGIVVEALKAVSERARPPVDNASGEFFSGGKSFPSGHAISAWSLATVVANEYKHRRFVQVSAYGLATAVSISRFTGRNHFLSDVLIGSALGYGIGRYVYRTHHDPSLDATDGEKLSSSGAHSKLLPLIAPRYSGGGRREREYGVVLAWNF